MFKNIYYCYQNVNKKVRNLKSLKMFFQFFFPYMGLYIFCKLYIVLRTKIEMFNEIYTKKTWFFPSHVVRLLFQFSLC